MAWINLHSAMWSHLRGYDTLLIWFAFMSSLVRAFLVPTPYCRLPLIVWIFHVVRGEMAHWLTTRQQHLIEKSHSTSVQARTVLITGIPKHYLTIEALYKMFNTLPGGVKKIWINRSVFLFACRSIVRFTWS